MTTHFPILTPGRVLAFSFAAAALVLPAFAQDDQPPAMPAMAPRDQAQAYFDNDEARKGLATLADAARKDPSDRILGSILYAAVRDHAWHMSQTLPIRHKGPVRVVVFSADAKLVASGSEFGEVIVTPTDPLDAEAMQKRQATLTLPDAITGLAFTKDGSRLAVASRAGWLRVWDPAKNQVIFTAPRGDQSMTAFAAAGGTGVVAAGMENGSIQIMDTAAGQLVATIRQAGGQVVAMAFSRDGTQIAAARADGKVWVYDATNGQPIGKDFQPGGTVASVDFSPDGRYVVAGGSEGRIRMWDPESGIQVIRSLACDSPVRKVATSPDGSMMAAILDDSSIIYMDALTGKKLDFDIREDAPFNDMAWSRTGLRVIVASAGGHADIWTSLNGSRFGEPMPHRGPVLSVALSFNTKLLASGGQDGMARVWFVGNGLPLPTVRTHSARVRTAFYSTDGNDLITASEDHTALHWISGQVQPQSPALKHKGKVTCATFDKGATRILSCDDSGIAQLWDAKTNMPVGEPYVHKEAVNWVDFHPDGDRFVSASGGTATIWSTEDRKKPLAVVKHPGNGKSVLKCARFSPDGKWLITASTDGTARVWDAKTYKPTGAVIKRSAALLCVRFSDDGSLLVATGEDAQAVVYDTATWKPVAPPIIAPGEVFSAFITPDNKFIGISAYLVNAVQLYEIKTGSSLGGGIPIPAQATCIDFLPRDKVIVVACDDGTVRAVGTPIVDQDVPPWMCDFTEIIAGMKKTGDDTFEPVDSNMAQLAAFITPEIQGDTHDFARLARWRLRTDPQKPGLPRFTSTILANIERRLDMRSISDLFECYNAVPGEPLIIGALSLEYPNQRHGEFLADLALASPDASPLTRCYAAGTLINSGRSQEAKVILEKAIADAPQDFRVLRRAAKCAARMDNKTQAVELFEKALALQPNDYETLRTYGWALYNFKQPATAEKQFLDAERVVGEMNDDLIAGICLCEAAQNNQQQAKVTYQRLVALNPDWKSAAYISELHGWTPLELGELESIRGALYGYTMK